MEPQQRYNSSMCVCNAERFVHSREFFFKMVPLLFLECEIMFSWLSYKEKERINGRFKYYHCMNKSVLQVH